METWNFQLELKRIPTDDEVDALYEADLDDAAVSDGTLDVDREASTLLKAVVSVLVQLRKVPGLHAVALLNNDPVTLSDAAQRLRGICTAESLRLYAEGKRGPGGFPAPLADTGNIRVYSWADIARYLAEIGDPVPEVDFDRVRIDRALRLRAGASRGGAEKVEVVEQILQAA